MQIREAREDDITDIVNLLRSSLGETLMPKSEAYWRWKHINNPFGKSPVLLCFEGNDLIGIRAFMRWKWTDGDKHYQSLRAVDTATHPNHQGKGIFKKLTLALVETCTELGDHFVFNTPNGQSKPGYIKMGWQEAGRLPVRVSVRRPHRMAWNFIRGGSPRLAETQTAMVQDLSHVGISELIKKDLRRRNQVVTNLSSEYLAWRYRDVPVASYEVYSDGDDKTLGALVIGRVKPGRYGIEFRITDFLYDQIDSALAAYKRLIRATAGRVDYVTMGGKDAMRHLSGLNSFSTVGPSVTIRSLGLKNLGFLTTFKGWSPSVGDLELF